MISRDDGARIWNLNFRLSTVLLGEAAAGIEALGIEIKEFFVLDGIDELSYPAEIAKRLSISRPMIALHVRNLERKLLLIREVDHEDLRRHRLTLTSKGRDVTSNARRLLSEAYAARLDRLAPGETELLGELLAKLVD